MQIRVIYQDDQLVVVDKPAGLPVHAAQQADPRPCAALPVVQAQLGLGYLGTHQPLEAEASGVLVCLVQREANARLAATIASTAAEQGYLALVYGVPKHAEGTIDAPLVRAGDRYRVTTPHDRRGQRAVTHYKVVETAPDGRYSLLEVVPEAGSGQQLRTHLAHLGVPVVGDPLYGPGGAEQQSPAPGRAGRARRPNPGKAGPPAAAPQHPASQFAPRLGLHLQHLTLPHPATGQPVTFVAPPPPLFTRLATGLPELALAAGQRHVRRIKPDAAGLSELIDLALARRAPLAADAQTTVYRLINAAADGLPGLAVDRYGNALVVSIYDDVGKPAPLAAGLVQRLLDATGSAAIYVKYRQREASRVDEDALPALAPAGPVAGRAVGEYPAQEEGLVYLLRPGEGWNPGLFPDMREMRARVRAWAGGKRILNCFAYTCGFGVAAMAGGAARAANLDVSAPLLERGRANYRANGFVPDDADFLYGDAFDWLPRLAQRHDLFDLVILDPPGFARTKTHTFSAAQNYGRLAQAAAPVLASGGLLVACCNVADLSAAGFRDRVIAGLDNAWRASEIVGVFQAPVLDFPTLPGRESHLKILVARLA